MYLKCKISTIDKRLEKLDIDQEPEWVNAAIMVPSIASWWSEDKNLTHVQTTGGHHFCTDLTSEELEASIQEYYGMVFDEEENKHLL